MDVIIVAQGREREGEIIRSSRGREELEETYTDASSCITRRTKPMKAISQFIRKKLIANGDESSTETGVR